MDQRSIEITIDHLTQSTDVDIDDVRLRIEVQIPNGLEEHRASDHLAGVSDKDLQKPEFPSCQRQSASGSSGGVRQQVEFEIGHSQSGGRCITRATREGFDAGHEFIHREGLAEIIVAAGAQPADSLIDRIQGREHDDGRPSTRRSDPLDDLETIETGQHTIRDDDGMLGLQGRRQPLRPVRDRRDRVTARRERDGDVVGDLAVVFDEQDRHGHS